MASSNSLTITLGYDGTEFTRKYKFNDLTDTQLSGAKARILAYNADIVTDDKNILISDDYDASGETPVGTLKAIVAAQYETTIFTRIEV